MIEEQFDFVEGRFLKQKGIDYAMSSTPALAWSIRADEWLGNQRRGFEFTSDDLTHAIGMPATGNNKSNSVGAWFNAKSGAREIMWTGRLHSSRRTACHAAIQKVWRVI